MEDSVIKSVRRVFEILELFDRERRPLTAQFVADQLDYPVVSAHALLKSMYVMGYIDLDRRKRVYTPSRSIAAITDWIPDFLEHESHIVDFARALNERTRETVSISRRVGARTRILFGLDCKYPIGVSSSVGTMMPVLHSLTGLTAIAELSAEERAWIIESERKLSPDSVLDDDTIASVLDEIAREGMSLRCDLLIDGIGAICVPISASNFRESLVIGVIGPSERIMANAAQYQQAIHELAAELSIPLHQPKKASKQVASG